MPVVQKAVCPTLRAAHAGQLRSEEWWLRQGSQVPPVPPELVLRHILEDVFSASTDAAAQGTAVPAAHAGEDPLAKAFSVPRTAPHNSLLARRAPRRPAPVRSVQRVWFETEQAVRRQIDRAFIKSNSPLDRTVPFALDVYAEPASAQAGAASTGVRQCAGHRAAVDPLRARAEVQALGNFHAPAPHAGCALWLHPAKHRFGSVYLILFCASNLAYVIWWRKPDPFKHEFG